MSNISRREFIKLVTAGGIVIGVAAVGAPVVAYFFPASLEEMPAEPVLVGAVADLPAGSSKTVRFGRYPALVIHTEAGLRAYSAVCTHFACLVKWEAERGEIICPCHDGFFDAIDGSVLSGPPPSGLLPLAVTTVGDEIYVGGEA